jgi:hypothetical protein
MQRYTLPTLRERVDDAPPAQFENEDCERRGLVALPLPCVRFCTPTCELFAPSRDQCMDEHAVIRAGGPQGGRWTNLS